MSAASIKAGEAYVEVATRDGLLNRGLNAAQTRVATFGRSVGSIGSEMANAFNFASRIVVVSTLLRVGSLAFAAVGAAITSAISLVGLLISAIVVSAAAIASLAGPIGLAVLAIGALGAALLQYTTFGQAGLVTLGNAWTWLLNTVLPIPIAIAKSLINGDITRAGSILWLSLQLMWREGTQSLYGLWVDFSTQLVNSIDPLLQPMLEIWNAVQTAVSEVFHNVVSIAASTWSYLGDGASAAWIFISEAAGGAFSTIASIWDQTFGIIFGSFGQLSRYWFEVLSNMTIDWTSTVQTISDVWNDTVNWIAKKLLYLYSLFDWSIDYEAAAKDMDAQNEAKKKTNRDNRESRKRQREEEAITLKDGFSDEINSLRSQLDKELSQVKDINFKMPELIKGLLPKFEALALKLPDITSLTKNLGSREQGTFSGFAAVSMANQKNDQAERQRERMITLQEETVKVIDAGKRLIGNIMVLFGAREN